MSIIAANTPLVVPVPAGFRLQFGTPISGSCVVTLPDRILTEALTDGEGLGPYQSDASISITSTVPGTCWTIRRDGPTVTLQAAHLAQAPYMPGVSVFIGESASGPATPAGWSGTQFQALVSGGSNYLPSSLKAAIDAYSLGARSRPPVIMFGPMDSNGAGQGAGTGGTGAYIGAYANSLGQQLKDYLPTLGGLELINTAWDGDGNMAVNAGFTLNGYDPRVTLGGTAALAASPGFIGGRWVQLPAQGDSFTINFGQRIDTVEVYSIQRSVATNFSTDMQIRASDGTQIGASYSQQTAGADAVVRETRTSAKFNDGIVTIVNNDSGRVGHLFCVIGYPTNKKVAVVMNGAWASGKISDFAASSQVFSGVGFHASILPDITFVALVINDTSAATAPATYNASYVTVLDKIKANGGDLVIATSCMCGFANYTNGTYANLRNELLKLAKTYDARFLPIDTLLGTYATSVAAGEMYDDRHMFKIGYGHQIRDGYAPFLRSLIA